MRAVFNPRENTIRFFGELAREKVDQVIRWSFADRLVCGMITYPSGNGMIVGLKLDTTIEGGSYQANDMKHLTNLVDRLDRVLTASEMGRAEATA